MLNYLSRSTVDSHSFVFFPVLAFMYVCVDSLNRRGTVCMSLLLLTSKITLKKSKKRLLLKSQNHYT